MNVEKGVLCSVDPETKTGKVKLGNTRIKEVKLDSSLDFKEGDKVKVILNLVVGKA